MKIYSFSWENFSILWIFNEIQGEKISDFVHCGICSAVRFATVYKYL
jgi:hypothetical protein